MESPRPAVDRRREKQKGRDAAETEYLAFEALSSSRPSAIDEADDEDI